MGWEDIRLAERLWSKYSSSEYRFDESFPRLFDDRGYT